MIRTKHHQTILLVSILLGGCYEGRVPPPVTRMLEIKGGSFTMGAGPKVKLKCTASSIAEIEHCDVPKQRENPLLWILDLSWVPGATARLVDFEIDEHEVTNAQYEYCVALGQCTPAGDELIDGEQYYGGLGGQP